MSTDHSIAQTTESPWRIWKTIQLGTGIKDGDGFRNAIQNSGMRVNHWANDILGKPEFRVAPEPTDIDLVTVTIAELGFDDGATLQQIYTAAKKCGLALCPSDGGPQLRLQYPDQPKGEWLLIGMEPIAYSNGDPSVFSVDRDDSGLWLSSHWLGSPGRVWGPGQCWVFVRPRK